MILYQNYSSEVGINVLLFPLLKSAKPRFPRGQAASSRSATLEAREPHCNERHIYRTHCALLALSKPHKTHSRASSSFQPSKCLRICRPPAAMSPSSTAATFPFAVSVPPTTLSPWPVSAHTVSTKSDRVSENRSEHGPVTEREIEGEKHRKRRQMMLQGALFAREEYRPGAVDKC